GPPTRGGRDPRRAGPRRPRRAGHPARGGARRPPRLADARRRAECPPGRRREAEPEAGRLRGRQIHRRERGKAAMSAEKVAEIRKLYFATTPKTIQRDLDRAIDILKKLKSDDERSKASVYMEGLNEMRKEWKGKR